MRYAVEKIVDGKHVFEVVEAENAPQAMNQCSLDFFMNEEGKLESTEQEVAYLGVFEISQSNLIEEMAHVADVHSFYHKKLTELGFDPMTFEKLSTRRREEQ
ncbi:type III secretion system protein PrgG [Enterococcus faecium]|nr:type III secretion system protein PrgG [Enterococcus faecium]